MQEYYDIDGLIPEELNIVTRASNDNKLAIVTIQQFFGYDIKGIFQDIIGEDLIERVINDEELRKSFLKFVEKTFDLYNKEKAMVDLMGKKNIVLAIDKNGEDVLRFIDPQSIKDVEGQLLVDSEEVEEYIEHLKYLDIIYDGVKRNSN